MHQIFFGTYYYFYFPSPRRDAPRRLESEVPLNR